MYYLVIYAKQRLTRMNCEMALKVVVVPELAIAKRTGTVLLSFAATFAVKLVSVQTVRFDVQRLPHTHQNPN